MRKEGGGSGREASEQTKVTSLRFGANSASNFMDNPWGNAWQEQATNKPAWQPTTTDIDDSQADIAIAPSWSSGVEIKWDGDVDTSSDHTNLWAQSTESLKVWESPYENLPLGKSPTPTESPRLPSPEAETEAEEPTEEGAEEDKEEETPDLSYIGFNAGQPSSPIRSSPETPLPAFRPPTPPRNSPSPSPPASPDAFGGFESGLETARSEETGEVDPWSSGFPAPEDGAWGSSAWGDLKPESETSPVEAKEEPVDEWETARIQKELQDKHVVGYSRKGSHIPSLMTFSASRASCFDSWAGRSTLVRSMARIQIRPGGSAVDV